MTELLPAVEPNGYRGLIVYFLQASNGMIKIGKTTRIRQRIVNIQAMSPLELRLVGWSPARGRYEAWLHDIFADDRAHGEWFHPSVRLLGLIREVETNYPSRHKVLRALLEAMKPNDHFLHGISTAFL